MAVVATARSSLLPSHALALLAAQAGISLPPGWEPEGAEQVDSAALLVAAGLVDATGTVEAALAAALEPLRAPRATVEIVLAPTAAHAPDPAGPAGAFTCLLVEGDDGIVGLLRGDAGPLVELTVAGPEAFAASLERVVACVPEQPAPVRVAERIGLGAFTALSAFDGHFDAETFAAGHDCDPDRVAAVAELLAATTHVLRVLVTGTPRGGSTPVGHALLYRGSFGWLDVANDGDDVVLRTARPASVLPAVATLLAVVR